MSKSSTIMRYGMMGVSTIVIPLAKKLFETIIDKNANQKMTIPNSEVEYYTSKGKALYEASK